MTDILEARTRIADTIGRDIVYVTSADKQRHFDPITFVVTYGGGLLLTFLGGAAIRLWNKTEEAAEKAGEAAVDRAWERLAELGKESGEDPADVEEAEQVQSLREAGSALDELSQQIVGSYLEEFLAGGKEAVEERLRQDHFPAAKSRRIADAIADEIKARLQQ